MMKIDAAATAGSTILSGAIAGRAWLMKLLEVVNATSDPAALYLVDFCDVEVATASFLRESIFGLKAFLRSNKSRACLAVANARPTVAEELSVIAEAQREYLLAVGLDAQGTVACPRILGQLEPIQLTTFERINQLGKVTASILKEKYSHEDGVVAPTVWNNRLAALANHGLIRESSQGRTKFYEPLFPEVSQWDRKN